MFIRDTPFEKTQHEASGKHQGNLKRFLRELHRDNERQHRESERAKHEVERLRQTVAGGTFSGKDSDIPPWKKTHIPPKNADRPVSVEERKRQMAQLAEMGVAIPEEFRGEMALAGEWQTLSEKVIGAEENGKQGSSATTMGVRRKRKLEGVDDEEDGDMERFVSKGWGSRTRQYPPAVSGEDDDLDALLASTKEIKKDKGLGSETVADGNDKESVTQIPAGDISAAHSEEVSDLKQNEPPIDTAPATSGAKAESESKVPGVVFKKRKPKAIRR